MCKPLHEQDTASRLTDHPTSDHSSQSWAVIHDESHERHHAGNSPPSGLEAASHLASQTWTIRFKLLFSETLAPGQTPDGLVTSLPVTIWRREDYSALKSNAVPNTSVVVPPQLTYCLYAVERATRRTALRNDHVRHHSDRSGTIDQVR